MLHKQIEGEIKYRFACLLLNQMHKDKFIIKDELISFKKRINQVIYPFTIRRNNYNFEGVLKIGT